MCLFAGSRPLDTGGHTARAQEALNASLSIPLDLCLLQNLQKDPLQVGLDVLLRQGFGGIFDMAQVFEFDPLRCPKCSGFMHIKSFIRDQHEIERFAKHIGVAAWKAPPALPSLLSTTE